MKINNEKEDHLCNTSYITKPKNSSGENFAFLIKLGAKKDRNVKARDHNCHTMKIHSFSIKGTDKRNYMILLSDDPLFCKYIRVSYVGNYYFRIQDKCHALHKDLSARKKIKENSQRINSCTATC
ncbi:MAG: hypothetical protein R3A12_01570 [Ignavibacteria bacterium]